MSDMLNRLLNPEVLIFVIGGTIAVVAIVFGTITGMVKAMGRERTRREIAAYIAEGSMTPEQGEKLLKAREPEG